MLGLRLTLRYYQSLARSGILHLDKGPLGYHVRRLGKLVISR